ncbi:MAG: DUF2309 domain-containing protein [Psychroflexus sp.]|nr:DUF2309 domain-containing protein [Psychroflexus sp.]
MKKEQLKNTIADAAQTIGKTWPLYAFVTSNPLSGYEGMPFPKAMNEAGNLSGGNLYPDPEVLEEAWQYGDINDKRLKALLKANKVSESPAECLKQMKSAKKRAKSSSDKDVDRLMVKWLMAFLDEGLAEWEMPGKDKGFYQAWRSLARYDNEIDIKAIENITDNALDTIKLILGDFPENVHKDIIRHHIAALPGWTGYIKYRLEENSTWQQKYDLTLEDYLAVRLSISRALGAKIVPKTADFDDDKKVNELKYIWLKTWEKSFQDRLSEQLRHQVVSKTDNEQRPDAQMVFCIDTRSELIRRHVESKGNYETFGYAGFFGIAMDYIDQNSGIDIKSCPPILSSAYKATEESKPDKKEDLEKYRLKQEKANFKDYFLKRMKNMLPSAFGFVEGAGFFYGLNLLARTLIPQHLYDPEKKQSRSYEHLCEPKLDHIHTDGADLKIEEKATIVKSAFTLMGWTSFADLVVFVGHGSHSKNNPFASSLDCGACAASPGRHNARMLARLANEDAVREYLKSDGIAIPDQTVFIGAEHNTTTDDILLFDADVPVDYSERLKQLKTDLQQAQVSATQERLKIDQKSVLKAHQKTNDWSETRPEWGLAKNKAFIIGPRDLTKHLNLEGSCFLHSYDWQLDENGNALEGIMQGPMVVTQWINNHYYFSTVDNDNYGGGSKIFHNISGRFGVVMGNGSDLKAGLPLQSVKATDEQLYHQPLRLSVYIHAPKQRIERILEKNNNLRSLLDNEWIYLLCVDPTENDQIFKYEKGLEWKDAFKSQAVLKHSSTSC